MSLFAAIADARQILGVQRAQRAVCRRDLATRRDDDAPRRRWRRRWLDVGLGLVFPAIPLLIPQFAWLAARDPARPAFPAILCCVYVILLRGWLFHAQALEFSAGDVLRAPSKAGVVLVRIWQHLPRMLFAGGCIATAYGLLLGEAIAAHPIASVALLAAAVASHAARTVGSLLARLHGGSRSVCGHLIPGALFTILAAMADGPFARELRIVLGGIAAVLWAIGGFLLYRGFRAEPRLHIRVLMSELAEAPHLVFAFGFLAPPAQLRELIAQGWPALVALAAAGLATIGGLAGLATAVHDAEESTPGSVFVQPADGPSTGDEEPVRVALATLHRGRRSLLRAQLYLHRRKHWVRPGAGFRRVLMPAVLHMLPLQFAVWCMLAFSNVRLVPALLAALFSPAWLAVDLGWRLHRLGVDFAAQARHNLRALVVSAVLPTLLVAGATGTLAGWNDERLRMLAVLVAAFAWRAGWRGFARVPETERRSAGAALTGLTFIILSGWLSVPPWWLVLVAIGTGIAGVVLRLRRLTERRLADAMCGADELVL